MSQSQPDRLDRIEATLEQVVQAIADLGRSIESITSNQAAANVDLRNSIESIGNDLRNSIESITSNQAAVNADLRSSVNSLISTANQHQENFMVVVNEIRAIREDMRTISTRVDRLEGE